MYQCESWIIKNAEQLRIHAFKLWCWRRLLRAPWTARRSNQSILKEINPEDWCRTGSSNPLATWCEEPPHWERLWCWERLRTRGEGGDRGWDGRMASPTQSTWVWENSGRWWRTGKPGVLLPMGFQRVRHNWAAKQQKCISNPIDTVTRDKS